jgi:hypothetical protein
MPPELDINALADQIGNDIFGSDESAGGGENSSSGPAGGATPPSQSAGTPPPPAPPLDIEDKWKEMPKAWKMEKKALWDRLQADKEIREYIHAREQDVVKGFDQYATGHKSWTELTTPFQSVLQQHPNVNPIQLMQTLLRNHLGILQSTPEQKRVMAQHLLKSYGIDLGNPAAGGPPNGGSQLPPEVQQTLQTVGQLRDELGRFKADAQAQAIEANRQLVAAFAAKPENKHFEEVGDDILHLLQTGAAPSLEKAYEMACWMNPVVREKILAEKAAAAPPPPKPPINVNGSGGTPPTKPKTGDDTLDEVMVKHYGPNWKTAH